MGYVAPVAFAFSFLCWTRGCAVYELSDSLQSCAEILTTLYPSQRVCRVIPGTQAQDGVDLIARNSTTSDYTDSSPPKDGRANTGRRLLHCRFVLSTRVNRNAYSLGKRGI